jgi:MFS family permease
MPDRLQRNIYLLYIIKAAKWFSLVMPVIVPFYRGNGLTAESLFVLKSVYAVATAIMEIPSGYLADIWGRKTTLLIGSILGFAGFSIYSISFSFEGFLVAEVILGIGVSFISGSDSAMLYDSLASQNRIDDYIKVEGRVTSIGNFSEALGGILGGLLAAVSLRMPFYFQAGIAFTAIPAALLLHEPERKIRIIKTNFMQIFSIARYALIQNRNLRWFILFSSFVGTATLSMAWFVQLYFIAIDLPISWFGLLWTLLNLIVGIAALLSHRLEKKLGFRWIMVLTLLLIPLGYSITGTIHSIWGLSVLALFYFFRGFITPVYKNYINILTSSDIRATVLSIRSLIIRLTFAIVGPFLGWSSDNLGTHQAMILGGGFFLVLCLVPFIPLMRSMKGMTNNPTQVHHVQG